MADQQATLDREHVLYGVGDTFSPGTVATNPFLFVDLFPNDVGGKPKWDVVAKTPHFNGVILKATEGTGYKDGGWFKKHWPAVRAAGGDRYGESWFRGAYHFLKPLLDGKKQAEFYLKTIEDAGGWGEGDILPIVDVEQGGERNSNRLATAAQWIECTSAWADTVREKLGRRICLYGRGAMRDLNIRDKMHCDVVWNPSYTERMVLHGLEAWSLDDIALWQYGGDGVGVASVHKLPLEVLGFGKVDVSVHIDGARKPTIDTLKARLID